MRSDNDGEAGRGAGRVALTPALRVTVALHGVGACLLVLAPAWWPWILAALAANHLVLSAAVLWPRGRLLGPNVVALDELAQSRNEVCLTFDDGPDPAVTPHVLDILARHHAHASFFCVGAKADAYPQLVEEIGKRGHSLENHSYSHSPTFAFWSAGRLQRDIERAQFAISRSAQRPPCFFRAPAGFRSPLLDGVLQRCGLRYASWTRRGFDTVRRDPARVLADLTRHLRAGDVLLLHDGSAARTVDGVPVVLAVLPLLLEAIAARGLRCVSLPMAFQKPGAAGADVGAMAMATR